MKKLLWILNFILAALVIIGDVYYMSHRLLWLKAITSLGFVLLGIINLIYAVKSKTGLRFSIIMILGLIFGMAGDIVLYVHFIGGAILFAIGHVLYFVAFCVKQRFTWKDLVCGGVLGAISVLIVTLIPAFNYENIVMEIICSFYAMIISFMVGKALSNLIREKTYVNVIIFMGTCLFFFSDLMLLLDVFSKASYVVGILCLATYYPAQCLLAYSIMLNKSK